ncbi:MAG: hypothetical protein M3R59_06580, partial [Verrucomicrobiota bacterium]|nr:hypothetical protein [Verrucomicrobiota bacterium]
IGFYVLAPQAAIESGVFEPQMTREDIDRTVRERVRAYEGTLDPWLDAYFAPLVSRISVECISWERLIADIEGAGDSAAPELRSFYDNCLKYNQPREQVRM